MKAAIFTIAFMFLGYTEAFARPVKPPAPDDLANSATLICNGTVESFPGADPNVATPELFNSPTLITAKIKILHVFKGDAPAELVLTYKIGPLVPNGPIRIYLEKSKRYRFFLKSTSTPGIFAGVLDGQYDDGFAVVPLTQDEREDSAYISKAEAIQIARKWIEKHYPGTPSLTEDELSRISHTTQPLEKYWCIESPHSFNGTWNFNLKKISSQKSQVENEKLEITPDRTVSVTSP